ncbi:hypothetical protein CCACVL1_05887, partial [Corchorus capsularis]
VAELDPLATAKWQQALEEKDKAIERKHRSVSTMKFKANDGENVDGDGE